MQNRPHSQQCPKFHNIQWLIEYHRLLRSASLLFKKLQFYLSWPIQFSTKFSWSHALASDCVNGTRPQCFTLTSGSFHTEDIVLQNIMCLSKELFRYTTTRKQLLTGLTRATENRFFAGSDRFIVCKTDSICIKRIFFGPKKKHTLRITYWPNFLD